MISFTIKGNAKDPDGSAMPKLKMTGNQSWMPKAQLYVRWKAHIQNTYLNSLSGQEYKDAIYNLQTLGKPISIKKGKAFMEIHIVWKNEAHGDPENVFGSIADALFYNDKHLDGKFTSEHSPLAKGSVDVIINVSE